MRPNLLLIILHYTSCLWFAFDGRVNRSIFPIIVNWVLSNSLRSNFPLKTSIVLLRSWPIHSYLRFFLAKGFSVFPRPPLLQIVLIIFWLVLISLFFKLFGCALLMSLVHIVKLVQKEIDLVNRYVPLAVLVNHSKYRLVLLFVNCKFLLHFAGLWVKKQALRLHLVICKLVQAGILVFARSH